MLSFQIPLANRQEFLLFYIALIIRYIYHLPYKSTSVWLIHFQSTSFAETTVY